MILGIGHDLQDIGRVMEVLNRHGERFLKRCFTSEEIVKAAKAEHEGRRAAILAMRFAAKEACAKALGTGFRNGIMMRDIGITNDTLGRPALRLTGAAAERLKSLPPSGMKAQIYLSLSDEPPVASAFVTIDAISGS